MFPSRFLRNSLISYCILPSFNYFLICVAERPAEDITCVLLFTTLARGDLEIIPAHSLGSDSSWDREAISLKGRGAVVLWF